MSRIVPTVLAVSDACVKAYEEEVKYHLRLLDEARTREDLEGVSYHAKAAEFCRFAAESYAQVRIKHEKRNR